LKIGRGQGREEIASPAPGIHGPGNPGRLLRIREVKIFTNALVYDTDNLKPVNGIIEIKLISNVIRGKTDPLI
jgi:hypothetical protein